jgi:hypothetical protein
MKKIKMLFYTLFVLDILVGCIVMLIANIVAGFFATFVLLCLNITVYNIILKIHRLSQNGTR